MRSGLVNGVERYFMAEERRDVSVSDFVAKECEALRKCSWLWNSVRLQTQTTQSWDWNVFFCYKWSILNFCSQFMTVLFSHAFFYVCTMCCFFQDLCDRHEKGLLNEHQRAIQKMGQYKKKKMSATVQTGAGEVSWHCVCRFIFLSDQITACSGDTQVVWDTSGRLLAKIFAYRNAVLHIAEVDQIFLTHSSLRSSFGGFVSRDVWSFILVFWVYHWFVMDIWPNCNGLCFCLQQLVVTVSSHNTYTSIRCQCIGIPQYLPKHQILSVYWNWCFCICQTCLCSFHVKIARQTVSVLRWLTI